MPRPHLALACASLVLTIPCAARASTLWTTGPNDVTFNFATGSDGSLPANQDRLTSSVWLTRGPSQGLYNAATESSFTHLVSPAGTQWAFAGLNQNSSFSYGTGAAGHDSLTFTDWETALGGSTALQFNILNRPAVLHILADDIYLDIQFSVWGSHFNNAFAYTRAAAPVLIPGDANSDGHVDLADYDIWYAHVGTPANGISTGDFNGDNNIDLSDYDVWYSHVGASPALASPLAAPEPSSLLLLSTGILLFRRRHPS